MPNMLPVKRNFYQADFSFMSGIKHAVSTLCLKHEPLLHLDQFEEIISIANKYDLFQELNEILLNIDSSELLNAIQNTSAWQAAKPCCSLM
jgi:hypothetical protein